MALSSQEEAGTGIQASAAPAVSVALEVTVAEDFWDGPDAVTVFPVGWCSVCGTSVDAGEHVARLDGQWLHAECARSKLDKLSARETWLTLASHMAHTPSKYPYRMHSVMLRQLLRYVAERDAA